jgi:glucosamine--fructose-6-phosphate aminotransferase (isomerizing)
MYLQDGDLVTLSAGHVSITDDTGAPVTRPVVILPPSVAALDRGPYRHFMAKEMDEQPIVTASTLRSFWDPVHETVIMEDAPPRPHSVDIIACGTSDELAASSGLTDSNLEQVFLKLTGRSLQDS